MAAISTHTPHTSDTIDPEERIILNLPSGMQQTWPVDENCRMDKDDIEVTIIEKQDLETVGRILFECFPKPVWEVLEPDSPVTLDDRMRRFARRTVPLLNEPRAHMIKAVHKPTRKIMGYALWHEPASYDEFPTHYPAIPDFVFSSCFTPNFNRDAHDIGIALGWDRSKDWSAADMDKIWSNEALTQCDRARAEVMGEKPHWFLAPVCVLPEYSGRGVSSMLIRWGMEKAREQKRQAESGVLNRRFLGVCCYLETMATARAVYLHHGFKECTEGSETDKMVWYP